VVRICGLGFATAGFDPIFYIDPGATFLLNGQSIRFADAFRLIVSSNLVDEHRRPIFESVDTWRFLDDGSNQGTDWRATDFNDTAWPQGRAEFGFGDGDEATTVRFGAHPADKHVTTYFRKDFQSELPQAQLQSLELDLIRDDGVAIYLNGVEIYRHNLSTDARFDTLAQSEIGESDEFRPQVLPINAETLPPGTWRQGRNVLAAEVHLASPDNADMSFAMSLMVRVVPDETKVKPRPFK
jgi:hypothetical protein